MKKMFLFFSAFIPMFLLLVIRLIVEYINDNITFNILNTTILILLIILIVLGVIGLLWSIYFEKDKSEQITIISKKNITDQHFLGYFSLFVLFALSFDLTKVSMFFVSVVVMILIGIVYVTNGMFYINPLLNILGFKFYEIEYKKTNSDKIHTAKFFYRGEFENNSKTVYNVILKNINFSFLDTKKIKK